MADMKIVIVGGVAGGASAAAKARRTNEHADITIFEKGPYVSFANCGLPYYVGETITERRQLLLNSPEQFWRRFRVRVHVNHEVLGIHRHEKSVSVTSRITGVSFREPYDRLILAPGAGAIIPRIPGIEAKNIFTVKTVPDSDAIKQYLDATSCHHALVIGAGFIGLETAEALVNRGLQVTVVEQADQVLPTFDKDMAELISRHLRSKGVTLLLGDGLRAFHSRDQVAGEAELQSGQRIPFDLAVLSLGVRPELQLAREAGLTIGKSGGIAVNDRQQTSDPDIFAAGDAVEVTHLVTGEKTRMPLGGPANKQGRVAGANAAGGTLRFPGALGTAIVESMGVTAAKTGLSEKEAHHYGYDAFVSFTHPLDHAGYYPGAEYLHMKLIAERRSGRLLGAQIVGEQGVDKRIDVLATAISGKMGVQDLENLDLAYAPQFSSAKGPVVMAGFVAANTLRGEVHTITSEELERKIGNRETIQLLDVRTPEEFHQGHLPQARLVPLDELRDHLAELNPLQETVVYCQAGLRGYLAARILLQHGFANVSNLTGGMLSYLFS